MQMRALSIRAARGFSLVEIAIVLVIISLIATVGLGALSTYAISQRLAALRTGQQTVRDALTNFVLKSNRLPCPAKATLPRTDPDYGREKCADASLQVSNALHGVVPWVTLGLAAEAVDDPWYRRYSYWVSRSATQLNANTLPAMGGSMSVHSSAPTSASNQINACPGTNDNSCNNLAVVVLISHGPNGNGAYTGDGQQLANGGQNEAENSDNSNEAFVRAEPSEVAGNVFDDVVLALNPEELLRPLIARDEIRSARAITDERMRETLDEVAADTINAATVGELPSSIITGKDGWGRALTYARVAGVTNVCGMAPNDPAVEIRSQGFDPNVATDDPPFLQGYAGQIRALMVRNGVHCP